jgi:hypothetical protein
MVMPSAKALPNTQSDRRDGFLKKGQKSLFARAARAPLFFLFNKVIKIPHVLVF